jgi:FkbM family methyltransferase
MKITTHDIAYSELVGFSDVLNKLFEISGHDDKYIEDKIFLRPKLRRSFAPLLMNAFFDLARNLQLRDIFEIGVMNGRHTSKILSMSDWSVHSFEPNIYCYPSLVPLLTNERLTLIPFAVSDYSGFADFYLPMNFLGRKLDEMSGVSSLNKSSLVADDSDYFKNQMVATITGKNYLQQKKIDPNGVGLWIDTEGSGASVLKGFGDCLNLIPLMIIEVEYGPHFSSSPNWNKVFAMLDHYKFEIIGRDFQTEGQCNILCINKNKFSGVNVNHLMRDYNDLRSQSKDYLIGDY